MFKDVSGLFRDVYQGLDFFLDPSVYCPHGIRGHAEFGVPYPVWTPDNMMHNDTCRCENAHEGVPAVTGAIINLKMV